VVFKHLLERVVVRAYVVFNQLQFELLLGLLRLFLECGVDPCDDVADAECAQVAVGEAVLDLAAVVVVRVRVVHVHSVVDRVHQHHEVLTADFVVFLQMVLLGFDRLLLAQAQSLELESFVLG